MKHTILTTDASERFGYYGSKYIPISWEFDKHAAPTRRRAWKIAELPDIRCAGIDKYAVRVEAVKLKRTYVTAGYNLPPWLKELTA